MTIGAFILFTLGAGVVFCRLYGLGWRWVVVTFVAWLIASSFFVVAMQTSADNQLGHWFLLPIIVFYVALLSLFLGSKKNFKFLIGVLGFPALFFVLIGM